MKKMISFMSILLIGLFLCSMPAYAVPTVSLKIAGDPVFEGDVFYVDVVADGVDFDPFFGDGDLLAFGFDLDIDPSIFTFNDATVGPTFVEDSGILFPEVAGNTFPSVGGDDILLATLDFTALVFGDHSLGITSNTSNPNEGLILLSSVVGIEESLDIYVNPAPVPEPATLLLLGTGLIGLVSYRRVKIK